MANSRLQELMNKWMHQSISKDEEIELMRFLSQESSEAQRLALASDIYKQTDNEIRLSREDADRIIADILEKGRVELFTEIAQKTISETPSTSVHTRIRPLGSFLKTTWFRYAAVILFLVATGAYLWFQNGREQAVTNAYKQLPIDIEPGRDGAILTLSDGTAVVLDSLGNGIITTQNGSQVVLQGGQLAYNPTGKVRGNAAYNTLSTPKGRQFNLQLPDGTRAWLNSASSLRYPTTFSNKERRVEITGEAYFEVTPDKKKPFLVKINDQAEIRVLGTSFNVNTYDNEASINTTLIEGAVSVSSAPNAPVVPSDRLEYTEKVILKPGQQAQLVIGRKGQPEIAVIDADIEKVMAWKNGLFNFQGKSLEEVMHQLERWYDIEVVYEKGIPNIRFGGEMSRDISLAGLIRVLEKSEVHFRIEEGRRLVVLP